MIDLNRKMLEAGSAEFEEAPMVCQDYWLRFNWMLEVRSISGHAVFNHVKK